MTMTDPLGDMLTRIRNAQMRKKEKVTTPTSSLRQRVLEVLQSEGYIRGLRNGAAAVSGWPVPRNALEFLPGRQYKDRYRA